jgi:NAD(P)-dependent dehydrogenase (short-subunit alcohol dehydrogenase family)
MSNQYLESMFGFKGKTVVITGGGGTLGSRIGSGLAQAGANVVLWDIRQEAMDAKVAMLVKDCGDKARASSQVADLMKEESIAEALKKTAACYGQVDILLNACGGNRGKAAYVDTKVEDFEFVLKLNLLAGQFLPTKVFCKYWIENKIKGSIVNFASMSSFIPLSGTHAYSAAKAAVMNQTMASAREFAPFSIRVNAIAPGFFLADQNRALLMDEKTGQPTERGRNVLAHTPFNRFGEPDELQGACLLLASNKAGAFISGITVPIDGAYMCYNI